VNTLKKLSKMHKKARKAAQKGNANKAREIERTLKAMTREDLYEKPEENLKGVW